MPLKRFNARIRRFIFLYVCAHAYASIFHNGFSLSISAFFAFSTSFPDAWSRCRTRLSLWECLHSLLSTLVYFLRLPVCAVTYSTTTLIGQHLPLGFMACTFYTTRRSCTYIYSTAVVSPVYFMRGHNSEVGGIRHVLLVNIQGEFTRIYLDISTTLKKRKFRWRHLVGDAAFLLLICLHGQPCLLRLHML